MALTTGDKICLAAALKYINEQVVSDLCSHYKNQNVKCNTGVGQDGPTFIRF